MYKTIQCQKKENTYFSKNGLILAAGIGEKIIQNGDYSIPAPDYVEENFSTKMVEIIQSYTGVVNKMVWRKN